MESWSYNVSPQLRNTLVGIGELRNTLLLTPLAPRFEILLRWEGTMRKIHWSLSLSGAGVSNQQVESNLTKTALPKAKEQREITNYKDALDYLSHEWIAEAKPVSLRTIQLLHEKVLAGTVEKKQLGKFRDSGKGAFDEIGSQSYALALPPAGEVEKLLASLFAHLNESPIKENPVMLAALAQIQIARIMPFEYGNGRVGRLLSLLLLYKYGFDCKGITCLEEQYRRDLKTYNRIFENALSGNFTEWLEYFAQSMLSEMQNVVEKVQKKVVASSIHTTFTQLSDRQKAILSLLDKPGETITNKKVQKHFHTSQITAARDLGKLKTLGLLTQYGRGRSTSYRRI